MKEEERLNYDQIMTLFNKFALDAKERNEEAQRRNEEARKRNEEAEERLKKLEKLVGGIGANNGHYAEEFFQNALSKTLTFAGIKFDKMIRNLKIQKKENCEFDIVLVNGDTIAIIEAKNRVHPNFVEELATQKLTQFRKLFPEYANYRIILGVAGLSFDDSVVEEANKFGVGMVRQDGKTVEINAESIKVY
jgi:hypothetical protein